MSEQEIWSVYVDGDEQSDNYMTKDQALAIADTYSELGYEVVAIRDINGNEEKVT